MVTCVNEKVQSYLFSSKEYIEDLCPPECDYTDFFVDQVHVSPDVTSKYRVDISGSSEGQWMGSRDTLLG